MSTPSRLAPAENMVITIARAQLRRGENPPVNTTSMLMIIIGRLVSGQSPEEFYDARDPEGEDPA